MILSKFSVWLRETARLYLRYMAVALGSIPFAIGAAVARQAGWNEHVILPIALLFGLATAFALWKWMGEWRVKPNRA